MNTSNNTATQGQAAEAHAAAISAIKNYQGRLLRDLSIQELIINLMGGPDADFQAEAYETSGLFLSLLVLLTDPEVHAKIAALEGYGIERMGERIRRVHEFLKNLSDNDYVHSGVILSTLEGHDPHIEQYDGYLSTAKYYNERYEGCKPQYVTLK